MLGTKMWRMWGLMIALVLVVLPWSTGHAGAASITPGKNATATTALNLRSGPGSNYAVQQVIPANASVFVNAGPLNTSWYDVSYNGARGHVFGAYLRQEAVGGGSSGSGTTIAAVNLRSGPGANYAVQIVVPAKAVVSILEGPVNEVWWKVNYAGNIGYVRSDFLPRNGNGGAKRIEVSLGKQWMYAYEGGEQIFAAPVSTGRDGMNTPVGTFKIFAKYPVQTMRGTLNGEPWVVPDVPNVQYITQSGVALHGAYWHNQFGTGARLSHGCVNLPLEAAAWLYNWSPIGTPVQVRQ